MTKKYKITYFSPYNFANFECKAETLEEARKKKEEFNQKNYYDIMNRDIRTEKFDGKKV